MPKLRCSSLVIAAAMLCQTAAVMPPLPAQAAQRTTESFAEAVRRMNATDDSRDLFDTLTFDKDTGTLLRDGALTDGTVGDVTVQNGRLLLKTAAVNTAGGNSIQSAGAYRSFAQAAAENGYSYTESDGVLTVTNEFQTARLIVKAKGSIDTHGAESEVSGYRDLHILQYDSPAEAYAAYQLYQADSAVQFVQPSHRVQLDAQVTDVASGEYLTWGADVIGTEDFIHTYLDAELLPEVTVAVVDTGINPEPALFEGRILGGGVNFSNSGDDSVNDDLGHGTHCTGTICELTTANVKILPVKVFDAVGSASDEQIYLGIMYAIEHGAGILSMSFGGLGVSPLEVEALAVAEERGVICCAASGNNGDDAAYYYPGGIDTAITVGAVSADMQRAAFSNFGDLVDVVAPGVGILSYTVGGADVTERLNGTSMATPHVTACCALLRSYDPEMTPRRAEALLRVNAFDLGPDGFDKNFAWGLVCMKNFRWDDGICLPVDFSVDPGNYGAVQTVALETETPDAEIYYTTDGSDPSAENGTKYQGEIEISVTTRLRAVAVRSGWLDSVVTEAVYSVKGQDVPDALTVENGVVTSYCGVRRQLTVPDGVMAIGEGAFRGNPFLESVTLPKTVKTVADTAFSECIYLTELTAPGLTEIGDSAFADCPSLTKLTHAGRLDAVGEGAFRGCVSLLSADVTGISALPEDCFKGCAAMHKLTAPDVTAFGNSALEGCSSLRTLNCAWEQVTALGNSAFSGCTLWAETLHLPALGTLGEGTFAGCKSLTAVTLPETVTELPRAVFSDCAGLRLLSVPGVTRIADDALALKKSACNLVSDLDCAAVTSVGTGAFMGYPFGNGLDTVEFSALHTLKYRAFAGALAGGLSFPQVTVLTEEAFADAQITVLTAEHAEAIEARALTGCRSAVLTAACKTIAADAWTEGMWVVCTLDDHPALDESLTPYALCEEPLLCGVSAQTVEVAQHGYAPLQVLGGAVGVTYQWFCDDEPVSGNAASFEVPTAASGAHVYRCVLTDSCGKTEQAEFAVTVTEGETPESLADGAYLLCDTADAVTCTVQAEFAALTLSVTGAVPVTGRLTDENGQTAAILRQHADGSASLVGNLASGTCYFTAEPLWQGAFLLRSGDAAAARRIHASWLSVPQAPIYTDIPQIAVTAPDGKTLVKERDYVCEVAPHNQQRTVSVFGIGDYTGFASCTVIAYPAVAAETVIPVSLVSADELAVYRFIPQETAKYYFYATAKPGYAEEQLSYNRAGRYLTGSRYVNIRPSCTVSSRPDDPEDYITATAENRALSNYFSYSVTLTAGQIYYFRCGAESAAEYNLIISQSKQTELKSLSVDGDFVARYQGEPFYPAVSVTDGEYTLIEHVDYERVDANNDRPGSAAVTLIGIGKYSGKRELKYQISQVARTGLGQQLTLGEPVNLTVKAGEPAYVYFEAALATGKKTARYRILNQKVSGGLLDYELFHVDERSGVWTVLTQEAKNDYDLQNGTYCIQVRRRYADVAASANFTVVIPHDLAACTVSAEAVPYTGGEVTPLLTVTADDGTVLRQDVDYTITYPDDNGNIMFGDARYTLRATDRSYGSYSDTFPIEVVLPDNPPLIGVGDYEAALTLDDRLAVYRVAPETDTDYTLASSDVMNIVLRVFSPEAEMLEQAYGNGTKSLSFHVPAGETRYLMVKFNGLRRWGTLHFSLETTLRLLSDCEAVTEPAVWTGERISPTVRFYDGDRLLTEGVDYALRYTCDDINIGTATANFIGMGDYFGVCDVEYHIIAADLEQLESFGSHPIVPDAIYSGAEQDEDSDYLVYRYTAGTFADQMRLSIYNCMCKTTIQRYDSEGHFADSIFIKPIGELEFSIRAGETCYFLFSKTDISGWNQIFRCTLQDVGSTDITYIEDRENGVSYRVSKQRNYAEANALDLTNEVIRLLPEIDGIPVLFYPEGLFVSVPSDTVVIGYPDCPVAEYADRYRFAYEIEGTASGGIASGGAGDLNGDGSGTIADAVLLARLITEQNNLDPASICTVNADLNADGIVDFRDLKRLLSFLAKA